MSDVVVEYTLDREDGVGARDYEVTANGQPVGFCGRYRRAGESSWRWWCDRAPTGDYPTRRAAVRAALELCGVQLRLDLVGA